MINIQTIQNIDAKPEFLDGVDIELALKYGVLFANIEDEIKIVLSKENLADSLSYAS